MFYYYDHKEAVENWLMTGECQEDMESFYCSNQHNWEETKFHLETAALAGNEVARNTLALGELEFDHLRNNDRAIKHWIIAVSARGYHAMYHLLLGMGKGMVSKDAIDTTLTAYNNACANMRSKARDNLISVILMMVKKQSCTFDKS
jgi:hypothetical protein